MRDLTSEEIEAAEAFGHAFTLAASLPKLHDSDIPELVQFVHACQNIIYARPGYESYVLQSKET